MYSSQALGAATLDGLELLNATIAADRLSACVLGVPCRKTVVVGLARNSGVLPERGFEPGGGGAPLGGRRARLNPARALIAPQLGQRRHLLFAPWIVGPTGFTSATVSTGAIALVAACLRRRAPSASADRTSVPSNSSGDLLQPCRLPCESYNALGL